MAKKGSVTEKKSVVDDDFQTDENLNENNGEGTWETGDVGEFEVVKLQTEGDMWIGYIISDCKGEKFPDWLPDGFDDNCFVTENTNGQKGIISGYYRLRQYVEKYGMGKNILYKITRGKKAGDKQDDFVNFDIKFRHVGK